MNKNDILDKYIQRAMRILRVGETEATIEAKKLLRAHRRILKLIEFEYASLSASGIKTLNTQIQNILLIHYSTGIIPRIEVAFREVAAREVLWNNALLKSMSIDASNLVANKTKIANKAFRSKYQGKTFNQWYKGLGAKKARDITREVADGYAKGLTTNSVVSSIKVHMNQELRHIKTLTRSAMSHAAYEAREELFKDNKEFIEGKIWISILDGRTTPYICGVRDGLKYTLANEPIGHGELWESGPGRIHFNCRSTWAPDIKGVSNVNPRSAISAGREYKRGDNLNRTGTVRKPTKKNRDNGIYKIEQVTTKTKYENWLKRQPTDFVADTLNSVEKAAEFKAGRLTLEETKFFSPTKAKPLTATNL